MQENWSPELKVNIDNHVENKTNAIEKRMLKKYEELKKIIENNHLEMKTNIQDLIEILKEK